MDMIEYKLNGLKTLLKDTNNEQKDKIKAVIKEVVPTFREPQNKD